MFLGQEVKMKFKRQGHTIRSKSLYYPLRGPTPL